MKKLFMLCVTLLLSSKCDEDQPATTSPSSDPASISKRLANTAKDTYTPSADLASVPKETKNTTTDPEKPEKEDNLCLIEAFDSKDNTAEITVRLSKGQEYYTYKNPNTNESVAFRFTEEKGQFRKTKKENGQGQDWILITSSSQKPNGCYAKWDYKVFGAEHKEDKKEEIGHQNNKGTGVLPYAIKGLLALAGELDIIIVSTGIYDQLGVHNKTKTYLEELKKKGKIQAYEILNSGAVPAKHNEYVKKGKRVGTLLHTTC